MSTVAETNLTPNRPTRRQRVAARYGASRFRIRPMVITLSTLLWVLLWSSLSPVVLLSGVLLGWLVGVVFPLPPMHWMGRPHPIGVLNLAFHLVVELVVSSVRMVGYAFARKVDLHAGIVRAELYADDDLYQVGVASLVSLVPGTVVVEVVRHPRRIYLHVVGMDRQRPEDVQQMVSRVERRLLGAVGSPAEIERLRAALAAAPEHPVATDWEAEADEALADETWGTEDQLGSTHDAKDADEPEVG